LKRLFSVQTGTWGEDPDGEHDIACARVADFNRQQFRIDDPPTLRSVPLAEQRRLNVLPGDLLLEKSGGTSINPVGCVVRFEGRGPVVCSNFVARLRARPDQSSRFWKYSLGAAYLDGRTWPYVRQTTGIQNLDLAGWLSMRMEVPSGEEQVGIADFLDRETAKIDALIGRQELMADRLIERRNAAILSAVTGSNAVGPRKTTGLEWLPSIPESWGVVPANRLCKIGTGDRDSNEAVEDGRYPLFLRSTKVAAINNWSFDCEAVMTAGDGQGGVGKVFHYFHGKFDAHQRVYVFRDFHGILGKYFFYCLSRILPDVVLGGTAKVTMESLRRPMLTHMVVPLPPELDQMRIVEQLDTEVERIESMLANVERLALLAQERRSALITAAVTGQLDISTGQVV